MAIPSHFGRYEIKSELGRGGMATVYHAYDPRFDREVALKVLPREMLHDPQFRTRFDRELKIVATLEHPAIVPVYDVGEEDGQPYFVMRYMNSGSLAKEIEKGKFSLEDAAHLIEKIAQGLTYAHKKKIVHRDLKPDNILFDDTGAPFISDFGVAKVTESTSSLTGSGIIGTPAYMSPEQAKGEEVDGRSDVYGLGVILYQMLSGQQPYSADTPMGVVVKHITEPVPEILKMLPDLPPEADAVIKKALAKDKESRYATPNDLAKALNLVALGHEGNTAAAPTGIRSGVFKSDQPDQPTAVTNSGKNRSTGFVVAGVVAVVAIVGFFLLQNQLFPAPVPTLTPTLAPPTLTVAPATSTSAVEPVTPTLEPASPIPFAAACSANNLPVPEVKETNRACITKIPYTTVRFTAGSTYQMPDPALKCEEEVTQDGFTIITCTGKQLTSYDLKVCSPPKLTNADLAKCSADATFDSANQCCAAVAPAEAGCVTFAVGIGGCP
ncbi:MAG: protein kinase [Anaerolineales bacterium]|nr:protein kinase [Anaerolineales bacterium]